MSARIQKAVTLHQQGRLQEAARIYRQVLRAQPTDVDCLHLLGVIETQQGNFRSSLELIERAIRLSPGQAAFHANRGIALRHLGRLEAALASQDAAIALQPGFAEAHCNRGAVLQELERFEDALASSDRAIAIRPDYAKAHSNRGNALQKLGRFDEALVAYSRAIALQPGAAEAHSNRGNLYSELKQYQAALADFERAIELSPAYADAYWNSGLCHLRLGQFQIGWERYEWRLRKPDFVAMHRQDFGCPRWPGQPALDGRLLLLHGEQGFGDMIQFARYAPVMAARGARVILSVPEPLVRLCQRLPKVEQVVSAKADAGRCDYHCSLLSLPHALGTTVETIPSAREAYLSADTSLVAKWSERLGYRPGGRSKPRVGLMWSGGTASKIRHRNIPLAQFAVLLDERYEFISLQKEVRESDREALAACTGLAHYGDEQADFADAAAIIELVDLVISVDTSIAHLAGALGKETWILLPHVADWRWMEGRDDSPWYPRVRLYRQATRGDWSTVLERVQLELRSRLQL